VGQETSCLHYTTKQRYLKRIWSGVPGVCYSWLKVRWRYWFINLQWHVCCNCNKIVLHTVHANIWFGLICKSTYNQIQKLLLFVSGFAPHLEKLFSICELFTKLCRCWFQVERVFREKLNLWPKAWAKTVFIKENPWTFALSKKCLSI